MANAGEALLLEDGTRAILESGEAILSDGAGDDCCCGEGPITVEQVCGCCYSNNSRAEFTLPELEVDPDYFLPWLDFDHGGGYAPWQIATGLTFIEWANANFTAVAAGRVPSLHWKLDVLVPNAFEAEGETGMFTTGIISWNARITVTIHCLGSEGDRRFVAEVLIVAAPAEAPYGDYELNGFVIQYWIDWLPATCCGRAVAPSNFENQSSYPPVRAVAGTNISHIAIVNNKACRQGNGTCIQIAEDSCGGGRNGTCLEGEAPLASAGAVSGCVGCGGESLVHLAGDPRAMEAALAES